MKTQTIITKSVLAAVLALLVACGDGTADDAIYEAELEAAAQATADQEAQAESVALVADVEDAAQQPAQAEELVEDKEQKLEPLVLSIRRLDGIGAGYEGPEAISFTVTGATQLAERAESDFAVEMCVAYERGEICELMPADINGLVFMDGSKSGVLEGHLEFSTLTQDLEPHNTVYVNARYCENGCVTAKMSYRPHRAGASSRGVMTNS